MTRKRTQHRAGACEPRIDRDVLRNHDDPERIDRGWERLDGELNASAPPHVARTTLWGRGRPGTAGPSSGGRRWALVAVAAAAGFAVGVGVSGDLSDKADHQPPVVMPADDLQPGQWVDAEFRAVTPFDVWATRKGNPDQWTG